MTALLLVSMFVGARAQQNDAVPQIALSTLEGQILRSDDLKDKIVVLDFWATWCEKCVNEIPQFNKLEKDYSSRGVQLIGLAVQSGWASDIQKFVKEYNMHYTVLVGNDDTVADFGVISFPNTYVIAPGWKLYKKYSGVSENKAANIRQDIEALLKAKESQKGSRQ